MHRRIREAVQRFGKSRLPFCLWGILLGLFAIQAVGCGSSPAPAPAPAVTVPSAAVPESAEKALFALDEEKKPDVVLNRQGRDFPFKSEKGFRFCVGDGILNAAQGSIILQSVEENIRFQLRPSNRIKLDARSLIIFSGSTRMEFRKVNGEYKIKLPTASLGIRGTKLEATVASDGTSLIRLFEGAVAVSQNGVETPLKERDSVLLRPSGPPEVNPPEASIPNFIKDLAQDEIRKAIQKF